MNVQKIATVIPITDEMLADCAGTARFLRRLVARLRLGETEDGAARLAVEDETGRELALRTPRYLPAIAAVYVAVSRPAIRSIAAGFGFALMLGAIIAVELVALALFFRLVLDMPR